LIELKAFLFAKRLFRVLEPKV